jgi:GntR family transcriptional regulator, transcriptional repressor for pyruvate dehydrogenase complex
MKSTIQFAPVTMGRASEEVALQIEAAILDRKIEPGDRLPSERELQLHFNTSRGVIREALQALKQKSLIEIKKGAKGGAYVRDVEVSTAGESLALFIKRQPLDRQHLIEFRESLDRTITLLAISRADEQEKNEMLVKAKTLATMLRQSDPDMNLLVELDRELNIMLARMTHNPIFEWIMQALQLGFSSSDVTLYQGEHYREKTGENWKNTAQAIADNEPLKALSHISYHYAMLLQLLDAMEPAGDVKQEGLTSTTKD